MMMQAMNAEEYHPNPAVRRIRAKLRAMTGMMKMPNEGAERDPVVRTEVKKHDDGTAHVVAHRKSGRAEIHEHPHKKAATEHARTMMSGGGGRGRDMDKTSAMSDPDDGQNKDGQNKAGRDKEGRNHDGWDEDNRDDDAMAESRSHSGSRLTSGEKPPKGLAASYLDDDMDRDDDEDEDDDYDRDDEEEEEEEDDDEDEDEDEDDEEQEDEECPSCGWWMADGRCPQCGYEEEEYGPDEDDEDY